jgi:hypothetical protein
VKESEEPAFTDAAQLKDRLRLPIMGDGLVGAAVCAAAAEAGSGERKPVAAAQQPDSPYPGVPLYDSFAFKSLLQKEGQRKERVHLDSVSTPSLLLRLLAHVSDTHADRWWLVGCVAQEW